MTCPFLLQEAIFSKKNPINLPLRDGPNGAQALAASGGEGRKHSADVHPRACRGHPPDPYAACGRKGTLEKEKAAITGCQNKYQILGYLEIHAWGI